MSFACYPSTTIRSTEAWNAMRCNALLFHSLPKLLYILIKPMEMIAHFIEKNAIFIFTCFNFQLAYTFGCVPDFYDMQSIKTQNLSILIIMNFIK